MWSKLDALARAASNISLVQKAVPQSLRGKLRPYLTARSMRKLPDRQYMEQTILPTFASMSPARVLFVGSEQYTAHYKNWFKDSDYWTMDIRPEVERFGSRGKHVTASVLEADKRFEPASFDLIFLNGVFGWGVDSIEDQNTTLRALKTILKPGGILLLGWNDHRVQEPLALTEMESLMHGIGNDLPKRQTFPESTHVYDFFRFEPDKPNA